MPQLFDFEVKHPEHPTVTVSSIGADSASIQAATERWGLTTREWAEIAAYITVRKLGVTLSPRCRRCGKEIEALSRREQSGWTGATGKAQGRPQADRVWPESEGSRASAEAAKRDKAAGLCQDCAAIEAQVRRDAARIRPHDRRAGYRER